jgi:hypothetical protein
MRRLRSTLARFNPNRYGLDEYSRYFEDIDGERYQIEPYPFGGISPNRIYRRVTQRRDVIAWFAATLVTGRCDLWKY